MDKPFKSIPIASQPRPGHDPDRDIGCRDVDREERSLLRRVLDQVAERFRARSLFVLHYCTGCGAIELPPAMTSRFDMERLGIQPMVTPRQADVLLLTGYLSVKTLKRVILAYEQMQAPKYVMGFGSCTLNGGMYWQSYATVKQLDSYLPVDMYLAGCMPRPEAILEGFMTLADNIQSGRARAWEGYYRDYDRYLRNQQALFGPTWCTPTDVVAEARHYGLLGAGTTGPGTDLLDQRACSIAPHAGCTVEAPLTEGEASR
jgi:NADH-quinone oxidoreductase subunit B